MDAGTGTDAGTVQDGCCSGSCPNVGKVDSFVFKIFPKFFVFFLVFAIVAYLIIWVDHYTLGNFLFTLCLSYAGGFTILGIPIIILMRRQFVGMELSFIVVFAISSVLAYLAYNIVGREMHEFISAFFWYMSRIGLSDSFYSVLGTVYGFSAIILLTTYGVLGVVSAYFRANYHRIFLALEKNNDSKLCRTSRRLFMVPGIIDVSEVTLNPEPVDKAVLMRTFARITKYLVISGLIISSYLLLNPVFTGSIPGQQMMAIIMMLSFFISTLVVPVSIVHSLGVEAHSVGNRPYPLWEGMRNRLLHPSFYIALFLTLLWVSLYVGVDAINILANYTGYFCFIILLSAIVSFVYVNTFYVPLREGIIERFDKRKNKG